MVGGYYSSLKEETKLISYLTLFFIISNPHQQDGGGVKVAINYFTLKSKIYLQLHKTTKQNIDGLSDINFHYYWQLIRQLTNKQMN